MECDLRLLDDLIDGLALLYREDQRDETRERLFQLILAHELGHVILHHPSAGYHGGPDGFSIFKYMHYQIELAADDYAVKLLDSSSTDFYSEYGLIVDLARQAVKKSLCPDTFPALCPCPGYTDPTLCSRIAYGPGLPLSGHEHFSVTLMGTHPEFIVRFARLLHLSTYSKARAMYGRAAREVLRRVTVRNEK